MIILPKVRFRLGTFHHKFIFENLGYRNKWMQTWKNTWFRKQIMLRLYRLREREGGRERERGKRPKLLCNSLRARPGTDCINKRCCGWISKLLTFFEYNYTWEFHVIFLYCNCWLKCSKDDKWLIIFLQKTEFFPIKKIKSPIKEPHLRRMKTAK